MTREYYIELVKQIGEQISERAEEIVGIMDFKREITITATIDAVTVPSITWSNTVYGRADVIRD